jgi:hypothetical protein
MTVRVRTGETATGKRKQMLASLASPTAWGDLTAAQRWEAVRLVLVFLLRRQGVEV